MPLQSSEKLAFEQVSASITQHAQTLASLVTALVADPAVNPLQAQLDAVTAERDAALSANLALQAKIDEARTQLQAAQAADAAEDAADAAGDASRQAAINALG